MKLAIVGSVWPEPTSSAAGLRDEAFLRIFGQAGWHLSYFSPAKPNSFSAELERRGIPVQSIEANDPRFDAAIGELEPDAVFFDRFVTEEQFGWRVEAYAPRAARILDMQDFHSLRLARSAALEAGAALGQVFDPALPLDQGPLLRELAAIHRSDLALVISDFEYELLAARYGVASEKLLYTPFSYPRAPASRTGWRERSGFVMIGNFRHGPNADAVRWLRQEIWPLVRARLPQARVDVLGAYPSREMMALTDESSGFHVRGPVTDQYATLARYRVNLAPLRFGAGLKGKIADGWLAGTPAVTTPIGAEGMGWNRERADAPWGGAVESSAHAIADAGARLHESEEAWQAASTRGRRQLSALFDEGQHGPRLLARVDALCADLEGARARNWVGAILRQQAYRSTEYFSRWIELKNRASQPQRPKPSDAT